MFSVDGLASGLDTTSIVEGALALQQSRLDRLAVRRQEISQEQSAFKTIEAQLLALRGGMSQILRSSNNAFDGRAATSSNEELIAVSAGTTARTGTHRVRVEQLAQAHQVSSDAFADPDQKIESGTFSIRVGERAEYSIQISDDNATVRGLVDGINEQSPDVSATIIDDGSGSEQPFRILISSQRTGTANQIEITNSLGARRPRGEQDEARIKPDFTGPVVQAAQDAKVKIGAGEGAIIVSSATNRFEELFEGVTFDVLSADPETEVTLTVERDTTQVREAVSAFVDAYNGVLEFIDTNSTFDAETESAGLLLGNRSAVSVQSKLRAAVSSAVEGVNKELRTLSALGIETSDQGRLVLDAGRLDDIVNGRVEGVGIDDIRRLFALDGQSDTAGVEFVLGTNNTRASLTDPETGELVPYGVEINRVAEAASVRANDSLAESIVIDENNDTLALEIDRAIIEIKLRHGSHSPTEIANQIESLANTSPDRAGRELRASLVDGQLVLESAAVGGSSSLEVLDGSANAVLGLSEGQSDTGTDVAGVFRVFLPDRTLTEKATGNGRLLTGAADNEYTAQLQVRSTLRPDQIAAPTDARLTVTRGIGAALDAAIDDLLGENGELSLVQSRLTAQTETIDGTIADVEERLEARRDALTREFAALESTLAELQSIGTSLAGLSPAALL